MRRTRALGSLLLALIAVAQPALAQNSDIVASTDRSSVRVNESFTYLLRAEGRARGDPDLSVLASDFDVLGTSSSTRIRILNGRTEQVAEWQVQLMPKHEGDITIPPVAVSGATSNAVDIKVLPELSPGDSLADVFMEIEAEPKSAYVQSQIIVTVRLFVGISTQRATWTPPQIAGGEAIIEKFGVDSQYQAMRKGRNFDVLERHYAVFPQESEKLRIGPATFEGTVVGNLGFSTVQRYRSPVIEVEVLPPVPPPAQFPDAAWLPASDLQITESWSGDPSELALGIPQTRTLEIDADGLLETQLPDLKLDQADGIRQYSDQPDLERTESDKGFTAHRTERLAVIAQKEGEVELPAIELPWFDIDDRVWKVARIESRTIDVAPSQETVVEPEQAPVVEAPPAAPEQAPAPPPPSRFWLSVSALLALGWLATALLWWRSRRSPAPADESREAPRGATRGRRQLLRDLRAACLQNDADEARQALMEWGERQFADAPPGSLGALADRLPEASARAVLDLETSLYGRAGAAWDGSDLLAALEEIVRTGPARDTVDDGDDLPPLFQ